MSDPQNSLVQLVPAPQLAEHLADARSLYEAGEHAQALEVLNDVLAQAPRSVEAYCLRSHVQQALGHVEAAREDLDRACSLGPEQPEPWLLRARNCLESGQSAQAVSDILAALRCDVSAAELTDAGELLIEAGEEDIALDTLGAALEQEHDALAALRLRGRLQMARGAFVAALSDFATCCILEPERAQHWVDRGNALYELGEYELAIRDFQSALSIEPALAEVSLNLGCIALDEDEVEVAIRYFDRAIELDRRSPRAHLNRGLAYYYREMDQKSEADFRTAIELEPEDADAYFGLARLLARQARYSQAAECLRQALERCPEYVDELISDHVFIDLRKLSSVKQMIAVASDLLD